MANIIKIKNSSQALKVPAPADLAWGEIALNYADGKIYYKKASDSTIQSISGGTGELADSVANWAVNSTFAGIANPTEIFFKSDGTKIFLLTAATINQYTLSTPWDITTAGTVSSANTTWDTVSNGMFISPDGTKLITCGQTAVVNAGLSILANEDRAYYLTLSTPWDITTATLVSSLRFNTGDAGLPAGETAPQGITFNSTGTIMYMAGATLDNIYQYTLSTAYNVSTATYSKLLYTGARISAPTGIRFNDIGTRMYITGSTYDNISEYRLSTAGDIATAVYYDKLYIGNYDNGPTGLFIDETSNSAFIVGSTFDLVTKFTTNSPGILIAPALATGKIDLVGDTRINNANLTVNKNLNVEGGSTFIGTIAANGISAYQISTSSSAITLGSSISGGATLITNAQTAGPIIIGGTVGTGAITLGQSTSSQILNLATGAKTSSTTASGTLSTIATTTLTVGGTVTGTFVVGMILSGAGVTPNTYITAIVTGTGGAGTYTISTSQTVSTATAITGSAEKLINIGTNGLSGSLTNINIGSSVAGATSTVTVSGALVGTLTGNATNVTGIVAVANGGTGTATPALVQGTNVTITGTWPNQTINASSSGTVTAVTGTAPVVSSGGTTPVISMPAATSAANGYMTSTYAAKLDGIASGATTNTGTVTAVAALTLGTTGTDVTSTVANGSTTPVITLNLPTASATNRGALSAANWTTFNGKQAALGYTPENAANKGVANGYAPLDASTKISSTYLPSYVDDVLEYANLAAITAATGETGKIYVALDTNKTYRWSGSAYVEISASPGSTDAVTEGSTNKYYTDARARASISATQNITYNSTTGVITGPVLSGYLTSYTETDTLATVTARGATTTVVPTFSNGAVIQGLTVGLGANAVGGNTVIGFSALGSAALSGASNSAVGIYALRLNNTGANNSTVGAYSLYYNTTGSSNSGIGIQALYNNVGGAQNTGVGAFSLSANTSGGSNIGIGYNAGNALTTGSNNTIIGSVVGTAGLSNTVIIAAGTAERLRVDSAGKMITKGQVETPDVTSLLTTANTYPTTRPSLNLDFANSATLDPRITFTRGTNATYTGSDGLVKTTAGINSPRFDWDPVTRECKGLLIEEARTNLWTYSNDFNYEGTRCWQSSILANVTVAPDGTYSADKIIENATNNSHNTSLSTAVVSGTTYTFSAYVKAAERTYASFDMNGNNGAFAGSAILVNLTAGTVSIAFGTPITYGITDAGNGWKRVYITQAAIANVTGVPSFGPAISGGGGYTGDGTSGIYIWGAQFEVGAFATSYIPSSVTWTGRASTATYVGSNGLIQTAASGVARYQYNPTNLSVAPFLLLEPAATNLLLYSQNFGQVWTLGAGTLTSNVTTAPDGTTTAAKWTENTTNDQHLISQGIGVVTVGSTYTLSVYAKQSDTRNLILTCYGEPYHDFSLTTGALLSGNMSTTATQLPNGWWRFSVTFIKTNTNGNFYIGTYNNNNVYTGDGTSGIYIWGAQVETGSVATSYIPTVASQVTRIADTSTSAQTTRSADVATMTNSNFSSWYNQTEGTFVVKAIRNSLGGVTYPGVFYVDDGTGGNSIGVVFYDTSGLLNYEIFVSNVGVANVNVASSILANTSYTTGVGYKLNSVSAVTNNGTLVTASPSVIPIVSRLILGRLRGSQVHLNGTIAKFTYYPTRLSNSTLQALTT